MNKFVKLINSHGEELEVTHSTFPAGEVYVRINNTSKVTNNMMIGLYDASADSIMRAIMLANASCSAGADIMCLETSYMPYSRQDRVCRAGESASFWEFSYILNEYFDEIVTVDVHNPNETIGMINQHPDWSGNFISVFSSVTDVIEMSNSSNILVLAPDKGALDRASAFALQFGLEVSSLDKTRNGDIVTQNILEPDKVSKAKTIILVDDICDGGATFISAAKEIKSINPNVDLFLVVSHGIFSAGLNTLQDYFLDIFVPDNQYNRNRLEML